MEGGRAEGERGGGQMVYVSSLVSSVLLSSLPHMLAMCYYPT